MSGFPPKRREIRQIVLKAIDKGKAKSQNFDAVSKSISIEELFEEEAVSAVDGWSVNELFDVVQGVTWGGFECEDIYVIDKTMTSSLEPNVIFQTIGGIDISAFKIDWKEKYLLFPYIKGTSKWIPAFRHSNLGGDDALDFSIMLSKFERNKDIQARLNYRIAKNVVSFPNAANYLLKYYNKLEQREFEGKKITEYNKAWYEYHRPRKPNLIAKPKIVCKRLMKTAAFALDRKGYLPRDSVISLIPKRKFDNARKNFEKVTRKRVTINHMFNYSLAFLNSEIFQELLEKKRSKKRGGYPIVGERLLKKLILPKPNSKNAAKFEKLLKGDVESVDLKSLYGPSKIKQRKLD